VSWTVELLDDRVESELDALPVDMRAHFQRIVALLEEFGAAVREPHVKSLGKGLFEMRMKGRDGISLAFYVHAHMQRLVVVRIFVKKTSATPQKEIDLARKRAKEVK